MSTAWKKPNDQTIVADIRLCDYIQIPCHTDICFNHLLYSLKGVYVVIYTK